MRVHGILMYQHLGLFQSEDLTKQVDENVFWLRTGSGSFHDFRVLYYFDGYKRETNPKLPPQPVHAGEIV